MPNPSVTGKDFFAIDPARCALIVIDMQNVWVKPGMAAYTPYCEAIVPNINRLAAATRGSRSPHRGLPSELDVAPRGAFADRDGA